MFLSGSLYYTHEQYADAQKQFSAYLSKYPKGQLRSQTQENLGYVYEQQGDYQQALVTFQEAETDAPATRKSALLLSIGRNYESLGQTEQAVQTYQSLLDSNTSSDWKDMARERMEILNPAAIAEVVEPEVVEPEAVEPEVVTPETQDEETTEEPETAQEPSEQ
jgi:tetratricopeptide (TPR) repeat protein